MRAEERLLRLVQKEDAIPLFIIPVHGASNRGWEWSSSSTEILVLAPSRSNSFHDGIAEPTARNDSTLETTPCAVWEGSLNSMASMMGSSHGAVSRVDHLDRPTCPVGSVSQSCRTAEAQTAEIQGEGGSHPRGISDTREADFQTGRSGTTTPDHRGEMRQRRFALTDRRKEVGPCSSTIDQQEPIALDILHHSDATHQNVMAV